MKRITFIGALIAAALLPVLADAQVNSRTISSGYMGSNADAPVRGLYRPGAGERVLADDVDAGVDFGASNNPILACSGLDIRDSISGMFDMSSLADDVKNYLTSLMAKQALSLVYSNPAIAGVLDGLKAFGNARFQLAQQSCEAIEGEISAQSRYLRQQALEKCIKDGGSVYECSVETGNYATALNAFVNSAEAKINNSIYSFTSRINILEPNYKAEMCRQLGRNKPEACAEAQMTDLVIPKTVIDKRGNPAATNNARVTAKNVRDGAFDDAAGANAVYLGALLSVADVFDGDIFQADAAIAQIARERKQAYQAAISANNGLMKPEAVRNIFERTRGERNFIGSAREMTIRVGADLEARFPHLIASQDGVDEPIGDHGPGYSYHYSGQAIDFNCNSHPDGEGACLDRVFAYLDQRRSELSIRELIWREPGHMTHLHVAFGGPGQGPATRDNLGSALYDAAGIVAGLSEAISAAGAAEVTTREARMNILREALKPVPLIIEDACFYDLDGDELNGLEDISDISKTFAMTNRANLMASKKRDEDDAGGAVAAALGIVNSLTAQYQSLKLTAGRLTLCYTISYVDRLSLMATQSKNDAQALAFIRDISDAVATEATITFYNALIYQTQQSKVLAIRSDAPPAMSEAFDMSIESLKTMRDSLQQTSRGRRDITFIQNQMLDSLEESSRRGGRTIDDINRGNARSSVGVN
jgi:hypothetical protein